METDSEEISSGNLRTSCVKLRGMAYLIELFGNQPVMPLDEDDCFYGISLVLTYIHDEIVEFARVIEQQEIKREQSKARSSTGKKK